MTFIPASVDNDLFVDGQAYAAISRNMAEGYGSFWAPYFADKFWLDYNLHHTSFFEHPPLMFGMQSVLFKILGDTEVVENLYNLLILCSLIWLIHKIWTELFLDNKALAHCSWLAVFFWYGFRVVKWCAPNNLLDTSMAVFCLLSCYFQLKIFSGNRNTWHWIVPGIFIFLAVLTKGPVGLYPLALPLLYEISLGKGRYRKAIAAVTIMASTISLLMALVLLYEPAMYGLSSYFNGQVVMALTQKRERIADGFTAHFYLLKILARDTLPHIILLSSMYIFMKIVGLKFQLSRHSQKVLLFSILVTMSGILPILISVKQWDSYLMPALPFFGISLGVLTVESLLVCSLRFRSVSMMFFYSAILLFVGGFYWFMNNLRGDIYYEMTHRISQYVPARSKIYLPERWAHVSEIYSPLQRYCRLSVTHRPSEAHYWLLDNKEYAHLNLVSRSKIASITSVAPNFKLLKVQ